MEIRHRSALSPQPLPLALSSQPASAYWQTRSRRLRQPPTRCNGRAVVGGRAADSASSAQRPSSATPISRSQRHSGQGGGWGGGARRRSRSSAGVFHLLNQWLPSSRFSTVHCSGAVRQSGLVSCQFTSVVPHRSAGLFSAQKCCHITTSRTQT